MSLVTRNATNGNHLVRYRDPFAVARELLAWDPFFTARPAVAAFSPAFEVKETAEAFVLRADLPGVAESDLDISVHNDTLTVSGSRRAEERKEGESYTLSERRFGAFSRSFVLPELADGDRIEASLEHGVLVLTIAKKAEAKPRKIALSK